MCRPLGEVGVCGRRRTGARSVKAQNKKKRGTLGSIGGAPRVRSMIACTIVESTNYLAIMLLYECGRHGTVVRPRQVEWRSGSAGISQGMLKQHCTYTK